MIKTVSSVLELFQISNAELTFFYKRSKNFTLLIVIPELYSRYLNLQNTALTHRIFGIKAIFAVFSYYYYDMEKNRMKKDFVRFPTNDNAIELKFPTYEKRRNFQNFTEVGPKIPKFIIYIQVILQLFNMHVQNFI